MKINKNAEFWKSILAGTNLPNNDAGFNLIAFYFINPLILAGRFGQPTKILRLLKLYFVQQGKIVFTQPVANDCLM